MLIESNIAVRYPDCDPMGIVHHAVYPIWYEIARMDYFSGVGYGYTDMNKEGINPPMVNFNLNYYAPVRYPGQVTVRTVCTMCQGKTLELRYNVYTEGRAEPVAAATSFHIWTGPDMKSLDMSTRPEIYQKLLGAVTRPAVLILAGGRSTRMGQDKAQAALGGKSLLLRAIDFWRQAMPGAKLYVSAGQPEHKLDLPEDVTCIYDITPGLGPMGGLQAAFRQTGEALFCVSAVDMPLLSGEALETLNKKRYGCEDICVFRQDENPEPLFGFYRNTCLPAIDQLISEGSYKMTALLKRCRTTLVPAPKACWLTNVNTPAELSEAEKQL